MKRILLMLSVLILMANHVVAADTNLNQSITVKRSLDDVIGAMQMYYYNTNYHGLASAVYSTSSVPGVNYTFDIADCAFNKNIGGILGEMVATRLTADSTQLEFIVKSVFENDDIVASVKKSMSKTLEQVAKIAGDTR